MGTATSTITDPKDHLVAVLKDFDTAMMFTRAQTGELRGRPMALAEIRDDGTTFLATQLSSEKIREFEADPHVALSVQGKTKWASISGRVRVNRDRELIHKLWREGWKVWFPNGKDDPNLCLLEFHASDGEYWDNSGWKGVQFVVKAAKAYLAGERFDKPDSNENAKVHL